MAVRPAGSETRPLPSATDAVVPAPEKPQAPPRSAVPKPLATERPKPSAASVCATGPVTVTTFVADAVAPSSSVTVSVTSYEPAAP
jgi:hypothetical protein